MDPAFNPKPYRGWNEDAAIIHLHGPKPRHIARFGRGAAPKPSDPARHKMSPERYEGLGGEYRRCLAEADAVR